MTTTLQILTGSTRLVFDCVAGITTTVEGMHETIARHPLPWSPEPDQPRKAHGLIAAATYSAIRGVNSLVREGFDLSTELQAVNEPVEQAPRSTSVTNAIAFLNGAIGDHLEATNNPLATPMCFTTPQQALTLNRDALCASFPPSRAAGTQQACGHIVVLVHGLSMSPMCWSKSGTPELGSKLQETEGCSPLYLSYNSGRHISTNGAQFAQQLEDLCESWPVPVTSLSLVGHSMGGLVIRSACAYAQRSDRLWLSKLRRVVCLGTPHHGSPVAKAGHGLNAVMQSIAYTQPMAFGRRRSAGIKDLRHGNLLDEDWCDIDPDTVHADSRLPVPLIPGVDYYFAAATLGEQEKAPLGRLLGDLLVRLDSATGAHTEANRNLNIKAKNCRIFHGKNHFDLLYDEQVQQQVLDWFSA